jgi:hypothetical protein
LVTKGSKGRTTAFPRRVGRGGRIPDSLRADGLPKFKNPARFLPEWIEFHQIVGFEHFYLYNDNSTDAYLGALTPYREEGLSRKVTSIVLNIIGTKHAGLHFLMTMNFFFRATGEQMLERFCVDTNHILRWLYIGWCLDHPGTCAVPKDSFWKTTCIVSRMSPQLLKALLIPVASRPQGVRITGFTKTMSSARMKKSDQ